MTIDAELVERMVEAAFATPEGAYLETRELFRGNWRKWMTAALRVAADALVIELKRTLAAQTILSFDHMDAICNTVRARLVPPAKTAEERVVRSPVGMGHGGEILEWEVRLDGTRKFGGFLDHRDAEIYRLGLIATLKEEGKPA